MVDLSLLPDSRESIYVGISTDVLSYSEHGKRVVKYFHYFVFLVANPYGDITGGSQEWWLPNMPSYPKFYKDRDPRIVPDMYYLYFVFPIGEQDANRSEELDKYMEEHYPSTLKKLFPALPWVDVEDII